MPDEHVGGLGGTVHGRRLQRRDAGVGACRRVGAGGEELRAQVGEIPARGQIESPIQRRAGCDERVHDLRRRRPDVGLGGQLQQRVSSDAELHNLRVGVQSRPQTVHVTGQDRMHGRLDPHINTHRHEGPILTTSPAGRPALFDFETERSSDVGAKDTSAVTPPSWNLRRAGDRC